MNAKVLISKKFYVSLQWTRGSVEANAVVCRPGGDRFDFATTEYPKRPKAKKKNVCGAHRTHINSTPHEINGMSFQA